MTAASLSNRFQRWIKSGLPATIARIRSSGQPPLNPMPLMTPPPNTTACQSRSGSFMGGTQKSTMGFSSSTWLRLPAATVTRQIHGMRRYSSFESVAGMSATSALSNGSESCGLSAMIRLRSASGRLSSRIWRANGAASVGELAACPSAADDAECRAVTKIQNRSRFDLWLRDISSSGTRGRG